MYFSFIQTSDLIIQLSEMFHVHSSCISNKPKSLTQYSIKCNSLLLKCFIQFACTNLDGSRKEGVIFKICFRKRGYPEKSWGMLIKLVIKAQELKQNLKLLMLKSCRKLLLLPKLNICEVSCCIILKIKTSQS